jgi:hypothetical protein
MAQSNAFKFANNILTNGGYDAADLVGAVGGGKVLQVVTVTTTSPTVTTSQSFVDMNLSLSITPSSASNKIFLIYTGGNETNGQNKEIIVQMLRDATQIGQSCMKNFANGGYVITQSISKLDSPNTTSSITYKMQGKSGDGTIIVLNVTVNDNVNTGTLTAFEIAA